MIFLTTVGFQPFRQFAGEKKFSPAMFIHSGVRWVRYIAKEVTSISKDSTRNVVANTTDLLRDLVTSLILVEYRIDLETLGPASIQATFDQAWS